MNPSYCLIYGYREDELLGRSFTTVFPPPQRDRVMALHRDYLDGRLCDLSGEWEVLRRDGAALNVIWRSVMVPENEGRSHRLVCVVDITDRRRMEQELVEELALARPLRREIESAIAQAHLLHRRHRLNVTLYQRIEPPSR